MEALLKTQKYNPPRLLPRAPERVLFKYRAPTSGLELSLPRYYFGTGPTLAHELSHTPKLLNSQNDFFVKREDRTAPAGFYGGNKVRNMEFILAQAAENGASEVSTLIPLGSNLGAALVSHATRVGLKVKLIQFVADLNEQTVRHFAFCKGLGADDMTYHGALSPVRALLHTLPSISSAGYVATGGSNALGAFSHFLAFEEFLSQVEAGEVPMPDYVFVGAGTCGTVTGITTAIVNRGLPIKVVAIRCADTPVCNSFRISRLHKQLCLMIGVRPRPESLKKSLKLVYYPEIGRYGSPSEAANRLARDFFENEKIDLDVTYTSKVVLGMKKYLFERGVKNKKILYWHTYSSGRF